MKRSTANLKLPKIALTVELALTGSRSREVDLFVDEHLDHAYRRQHVIDLLQSEARFLPAHDVADDTWTLFNKASVAWVGVPFVDDDLPIEEQPETLDAELYDIRAHVRVELISSKVLEGDVLYSPPAERARVADYLNEPERFFGLWTEDHLFLINKAHVLRVVELAGDRSDS